MNWFWYSSKIFKRVFSLIYEIGFVRLTRNDNVFSILEELLYISIVSRTTNKKRHQKYAWWQFPGFKLDVDLRHLTKDFFKHENKFPEMLKKSNVSELLYSHYCNRLNFFKNFISSSNGYFVIWTVRSNALIL